MRFDLLTLYGLAIGTLILGSLALWRESRTMASWSKALRVQSLGLSALAAGCLLAIVRQHLPPDLGAALSNVAMLSGYLLLLNGAAMLNDRTWSVWSPIILFIDTTAWILTPPEWHGVLWNYACGLPICLVSAATALELRRYALVHAPEARTAACLAPALHAVLYGCRCLVLPMVVAKEGPIALDVAATMTMYEGVLYSVAMPLTVMTIVWRVHHGFLADASLRDELTRIGNRRYFFRNGGGAARSAIGETAIVAFDLDAFKAINDRYGHAGGDVVLRAFAETAARGLPPTTVLARMGGEEFAAVLPNCSAVAALRFAEQIRQDFAARDIQIDGRPISATVSAGIACEACPEGDVDDLLRRADMALYEAKRRGRNRVASASAADGDAVETFHVGSRSQEARPIRSIASARSANAGVGDTVVYVREWGRTR